LIDIKHHKTYIVVMDVDMVTQNTKKQYMYLFGMLLTAVTLFTATVIFGTGVLD